MSDFQPSNHSYYGAVSPEAIAAIAGLVGNIAGAGISAASNASLVQAQTKQADAEAKQQMKMLKLQAAADNAQTVAVAAAAVPEKQSSNTVFYVVGGAVLVTAILAGTLLYLHRAKGSTPEVEAEPDVDAEAYDEDDADAAEAA